jgi:hypothetical protein
MSLYLNLALSRTVIFKLIKNQEASEVCTLSLPYHLEHISVQSHDTAPLVLPQCPPHGDLFPSYLTGGEPHSVGTPAGHKITQGRNS